MNEYTVERAVHRIHQRQGLNPHSTRSAFKVIGLVSVGLTVVSAVGIVADLALI